MKKKISFSLAILMICIIGSALADIGSLVFQVAEHIEETNEGNDILLPAEADPDGSIYPFTGTDSDARKYTVMLYLCGSDLEYSSKNRDGAATRDLKEIINSGYDDSGMSVLVMAGGSLKWRNEAVDANDTAIYEVVGDTLVKRKSQGLTNMGDVNTLAEFIDYGYEKFPAENYALIIWDHGGGPVGSLVYDKIASSAMTVKNVQEALASSKASERKLSWLGFDACLMGSVEIAKEVVPYADYLIASAEVEPSEGWYYKFLNGMTNDSSPLETGERIVNTYEEQYLAAGTKADLTLVCLDLSRIAELEEASGAFFDKINDQLNREEYNNFASLRQNTIWFRQEDLDLVDLKNLTNNFRDLAGDEASRLSNIIDEAIVKVYTNIENSSGLSTYFPYYDLKSYDSYRQELYKQLNYSESYLKFIEHFVELENGKDATNWSSLTSGAINRDTRTLFTLQLTEDQVKNLADNSFAIIRRIVSDQGDTCYVIVNDSEKPELQGTALFADYVHRALYVVDENGNLLHEQPLRWAIDRDGNIQIEAWLNVGENRDLVQLTCSQTENADDLQILEILMWDEAGQYFSNRYAVDPESYDSISFVVPGFSETRDEDGVLLGISDWDQIKEWSYEFDIHGSWTLKMMEDTIDQQELSAAFVLTDYQRRTHTNELMRVVPEGANPDGLVLTYDDDYLTILSANVVLNQNDVYLMLNVQNPNQEEIFVHLNQVSVNGADSELETWIEGDGDFGGIPEGENGMGTLIIPQNLLSDQNALQTISFHVAIVNAESRDEIHDIAVEGYMERASE